VSKNQQNKFNFFVEADIKKGKDEKGDDVVIIDGIASTSSTDDSDGETLYPSGFNLQPFLESGLVNYNHQGSKDSNANIGVPLEAKVINNGKDLYVKCMLWPCPQTEGIVRAYEAFKKYNIDRTIGFSIEGKSTYKDPFNKKRILKADISGLAVTFCPKNKNTLMNIIKGEYDTAYIGDSDLDLLDLADEYKEWTSAKEGDEFYGKKENVREFLQNNHEDHLHLLDELLAVVNGQTEKAIDTAALAPAMPESVEHNPKDISKNFVSNNIITNFGKDLKKSEIFIAIANKYPQTSIAEQKNIFQFVGDVSSKIFKMEVVTPESLQKAFDLLNEATALVKGEQSNSADNNIQKSESAIDFESDEVKKAVEMASFLQKGGMEKEQGCDYLTKGGFSLEVAQASWEKALSATKSQQNGGEVNTQEAPIVKSEEITALVKSEISDALNPVNGSLEKVNDAITKGFEGLGQIVKSLQQQNETLVQNNTALAQRLEKLESTPVGRKSIPNAQFAERFQKSQDSGTADENTYNVTDPQDLNRLTDVLFETYNELLEKGRKNDASLVEGTINTIECHKQVPEYAYKFLAQRGIKLVAPSK
jgi:cell division protein FtsB